MIYRNYNNTYVRSLYSPGYSFIILSLYKSNMVLGFTPWIGGTQQYDKRRFQSTSIDYEKAAALCLLAKPILEGRQNIPVRYAIPCINQTSLMLELKPDQDGQMRAYLIIEKKKEQVVFQFSTQTYKVNENGRAVEKVIQSGLGVFIMTLEAYLTGIGIDAHINKLSDNQLSDPQVQEPAW